MSTKYTERKKKRLYFETQSFIRFFCVLHCYVGIYGKYFDPFPNKVRKFNCYGIECIKMLGVEIVKKKHFECVGIDVTSNVILMLKC